MQRNRYRIAVVDDELSNLESLERILKSDGAEVETFLEPRSALKAVSTKSFDVVLTDLRMDSLSGLELLEAIQIHDATIQVVLITAYGTVEMAVQAMKKGAYDFITKPLQKVQVIRVVHRALEKRRLISENLSLKDEIRAQDKMGKIIVGRSPMLRKVVDVAKQAALSKANVLIEGESGTGKGLIAEYLHDQSQQSQGVFVKVNCAAIPETLLEAELFGHEKGAFTGASRAKQGRVELAHHGSLFLDEIGTAPISFQTKLLRFVQEGEFERLGSNVTQKIDTRVVSATNCDLSKAIKEGRFREDLFYRLNVVHITMPPLRDRQEDIPLLAQKFLEESAKKNGREAPMLERDAIEALVGYHWPGNIRELENLMECAVVLNKTGKISADDLPRELGGEKRARMLAVPIGLRLRDVERLLMDETLNSTRGDKRLAAKLFGIHPRTIYRHLETISKKDETE